jgi:hypothetical protein
MKSYLASGDSHSSRFTRGLSYAALWMVATVALAASGCLGQPSSPGDETAEAAQDLMGPIKVCEALPSGSTIDAPDGWAIANCRNWAKSVNMNDYRVGCLFDGGSFSWGTSHDEPFGADLPNPNCGWSCVSNVGASCVAGSCKCGRIQRGIPGSIDCEGTCIAEESCSDLCGF